MALTRPRAGDRPARPRSTLHGARLPAPVLLLASLGALSGLLFAAVYSVDGAFRAGYDPVAQPISALSLGPGGWVQRANFAAAGLLLVGSALGWRRALHPGPGGSAIPVLLLLAGGSLVGAGIFSEDALPGYPPDARLTHTVHGDLHVLFSGLAIATLAATCFVLAQRFWAEPSWRGWSPLALVTGVVSLGFMTAFAVHGAHGGHSGLFERLSGGVVDLFGVAIVCRLFIQAGLPVADGWWLRTGSRRNGMGTSDPG